MILPKTVSAKKASLFIFTSLFFISGPILLTFLYYQSQRALKLKDPSFVIKEVKVHTTKRDSLPNDYFEELLNLSKDKPTNIATLTPSQAKFKLKKSPVIDTVDVKIEGNALLIDYQMKNPLCILIDYENTLIDTKGVIFPQEPYFSKRRLPELYLGLPPYGEETHFGELLVSESRELAFWLLKTVSKTLLGEKTRLIRIDTSKAFAKSLGEQEIVVTLNERLQNKTITVFLRLSPDTIEQGFEHYTILREYLSKKNQERDLIVDLRLNFALLQQISTS